jgi:protein-S-isoprenylcysteine O-methyltransferase Ste14
MAGLEHKIPPPVIGLICAAGMYAAAKYTPPVDMTPLWKWLLVSAFALTGLALDCSGLLAFLRRHTTVNPLRPEKSTALVTGGIYQLSRNPMYLGMACLLLAWALYLQSPAALLGVPAFMAYITHFQIKPEERILEQLFGDEFKHYITRVRRWL